MKTNRTIDTGTGSTVGLRELNTSAALAPPWEQRLWQALYSTPWVQRPVAGNTPAPEHTTIQTNGCNSNRRRK